MSYDSSTGRVETIYDCSKGGFAEKRCKSALEKCENDKKTINTVKKELKMKTVIY